MNHIIRTTVLGMLLLASLTPSFAQPASPDKKPETPPPAVVVRDTPAAPAQPTVKENISPKLPAPPREREYRSGWVGDKLKLNNF